MTDTAHSLSVKDVEGERYAHCIRVRQHMLYADEPELSGGSDMGLAPYDFLLAGLGACTAITLKMYASRHGLDLHHTTVELRHEVQLSKDARLDCFDRVIRLEGNLSDDERMQLMHVAEHCPVSQTLRKTSVIRTELAGVNPSNSANVPEMPSIQ